MNTSRENAISLAAGLTIRRAGESDCAVMADMRLSLFLEERGMPDTSNQRSAFTPAIAEHLAARMCDGECIAWVGEMAGEVVATGALLRFVRLPHPGNPSGKEAYLLNMYTLPAWRGRGLASAITEAAIAFAKTDGIDRVWLEASDSATSVYECRGFTRTANAMEYILWTAPGNGS